MLSDSCHDLCYTFGLYGDTNEILYSNQLKALNESEVNHAIQEFRVSLKYYSKEPYCYEPSIIGKLRLVLSLYGKGVLPVSQFIAVIESVRIYCDTNSDNVDVLLSLILQIMESPDNTTASHMALVSFNSLVEIKPALIANAPIPKPLAKVISLFDS